jgi:hypothetical protein
MVEDQSEKWLILDLGDAVSFDIAKLVEMIDEGCFMGNHTFETVTFEAGSRLQRIEEDAFVWTGLISVAILTSVIVSGESAFISAIPLNP